MPSYHLTLFPEVAGKPVKFLNDNDVLPFMLYVDKIRNIQNGNGSMLLPGMVNVHVGLVLIENTLNPIEVYLIAQPPIEELTRARELRDAVGVKGADIPDTIRLLANLNDRLEKDNVQLRSKVQALEFKNEIIA